MKNLVIFVDSLKRDGAERVSVNLAKYMSLNGIKTTLVTEWISKNEYNVPNGVERISLDAHNNKYVGYPKNILKFRNILKSLKPDVLLVMDLPGCLLAIPAAKGLGIKVVVSERNAPTHFPGKKIVANFSRWLMSTADGFVFQTEGAKSFYNTLVGGRGIIIPNPIFVEDMPKPYVGEREKIIVTAGRLTKQKNQKMLLEAFSEVKKIFPEYKLTVYGEGELLKELKSLAINLGIENSVNFPGNRRDWLYKSLKASMFVLTSDFEGMPNVLLEAMAIGLPCISTDCPCGGPKHVIKDGINGLLIEVGDVHSCTIRMEQLIRDTELASILGKNAMTIRNTLDATVICKEWNNYLNII